MTAPALAAVSLKSPSGPAWEFLILFLVIIVGPPLMTRARVPGIIGLLIGGFAIGPYGLNLIGAGNTTVPDLGQLGLLYLMFVAGVELDLALVRVHRRAVISYGVLTFALPMLFGTVIGLALGWVLPAALLLGALLSSHTLLLYPTARAAGLSADRGVATAVGATVLTDTAALVVLAAVSGTQVAGGSPASIALQIVVGLLVVVVFTLVLLPRLARIAFSYLGTDRVVRYLLAVASFLAAGTVADIFGIEPIVGAFFAGLALNRLVPNEGPLMDRIDFFGSAVFVPIFLVSVGLLLDPKVMVEGETLKLAGLFIAASLVGKAASAGIARLALGYSGPQATLMLGLTIPQAAATLAATIVGFNIGLFDQSVVNAALVLILVSIVVGTLLVDRAVPTVPPPEGASERIGVRILVALTDPRQAPLAFQLAALIAVAEGGVVRGLLASPRDQAESAAGLLAELDAAAYAVGIDAESRLLVHDSLAESVVNVATENRASLVIVGRPSTPGPSPFASTGEAIAAALAAPVAILVGDAERIREVEVVREPEHVVGSFDTDGLAVEL
ncbi:MAG TPA: cation:proton antiporter, partial [Solirubrobacterales bacterium]|nr:cation:proton antiporter [Solirubrobacterales bacterium]